MSPYESITGGAPHGHSGVKGLLPNALIIGVQKASTSWLSARLAQHPDAFVVPGEVHFFDHPENYVKGPDWYSARFKGAEQSAIRLEKTGAYFWTSCADVPGEPHDKPERIAALLSDVRLIIMLRDPVARAYSAWNHVVRSGRVHGSAPDFFASEIAQDVRVHGILTRGLYHAQLARYLEVFPREQILVLIKERDVVASPADGLKQVCWFLGLDPDGTFTALKQRDNRYDGTLLGNRITVLLSGVLHQAVHRLDRYVLSRLPLARLPYPSRDEVTREKLAAYCKDDCRRIAEVIGLLPESWLGGRLAA